MPKKKSNEVIRWALLWHTKKNENHIMFNNGLPLLFCVREIARKHAEEHYGYIKTREDLRKAPYYWRFPKAIKVRITIEQLPQLKRIKIWLIKRDNISESSKEYVDDLSGRF